ncbi:MAG: response regulator [Deltaproteobacteria bacterium]|nr:response regulator [Deltaproteobacteria bacterium]
MKDILIVEDGRQERQRLEKLFSGAGYAVEAAESVGEAEGFLMREQFRLVVLDIGLGDRSGSYLFGVIRREARAAEVIVFTGNPSVHLRQRFISEGAADYIVKGTGQAGNEQFLSRVKEIIGDPQGSSMEGLSLHDFLEMYVAPTSRKLFLDMDDSYPKCSGCGSQSYIVTFAHQPQMPPEVSGLVVCSVCAKPMDPEIR